MRQRLPFVPQTARTTRFQQSYMIYALENYQIIVSLYNGVIFCLYCVYVDPASGLPNTINVCVCVCVCVKCRHVERLLV